MAESISNDPVEAVRRKTKIEANEINGVDRNHSCYRSAKSLHKFGLQRAQVHAQKRAQEAEKKAKRAAARAKAKQKKEAAAT